MNKKAVLTYNSGAIKFKNTNADFKTYQITPTKTIGQLLSLVDNNVYDLFYFKNLEEYNIKDFFFFYENIREDTKMDLSTLMVKDSSKTFLIFIEIDKNAKLTVDGTYYWVGENPIFESGKKYLFLVEKDSSQDLKLTLIARTVEQDTSISLTFRFEKGSNMELDLSSMFPNEICGYYPKYRGKINWGDNEDSFDNFYNDKNVSHVYTYPEDDNGLNYCDFTVKITGICEGLGQVPFNCIKCDEIKGVRFFGKCFSYCTKFESFPENFFHGIGPQTEIHGCFQGTRISSIPKNLFPENNKIKKIISLFSECVFLNDTNSEESIIPEDLFKPLKNLEELISVFDSSYYITKVPKNIFQYNPKLKNVDRCFAILGLDKGSVDLDLSPSQQVINNIPDGIVNGLNIKRTESVFSGLGLGRLLRHVDDKNNPHEVTLQQVYDESEVKLLSNNEENVKLNINSGLDLNHKDENGLKISDGNSEFYGVPLKVLDAQEEFHAVTLKQLREAELNHVELKGEWNPENGDLNLDKSSGSCYYVNSNGVFFDIEWSVGDFLLFDSSQRAIKMENDVSFKEIFEEKNGNEARLSVSKVLLNNTGSETIFKVSSNIEESVVLGHPTGTKLEFTNGKIELIGDLPLTLSADPVSDLDAVTKRFLSDAIKLLKSGNNILNSGDSYDNGNWATKWSGRNLFTGRTDISSFTFSNIENPQQNIETYGWNNVESYNIRIGSGINGVLNAPEAGATTTLSATKSGESILELYFKDSAPKNTESYHKETVSSGNFESNIVIEANSSTNAVSEITKYTLNGDRYKEFKGNIKVTTDKSGVENFDSNEFITKNVTEEISEDIATEVAEETVQAWANGKFNKVVSNREIYFDGLHNDAQVDGCRYIIKNNGVSGIYRINGLRFQSGTTNVSNQNYYNGNVMIGLYTMNSEADTAANKPKWHYPLKLVAYSLDENVVNTKDGTMLFQKIVQALPREEGRTGYQAGDGAVSTEPVILRNPHEFTCRFEDEEISPDDTNNPGIYWDFSEPMLVAFFAVEEYQDENGVTQRKLPPIEGKFISRKGDDMPEQTFASNIVVRMQCGSTVSGVDEVASKYIYSPNRWGFSPARPKDPYYAGSKNLIVMDLIVKGTDELYAFNVNTSGKYLTGTNNIWTGKNDFYSAELTYKVAEKDTEVVTVEFVKNKIFPIGHVYSTSIEGSFPSINNTTWALIGTTTIGSKTIYHYERTN